MSITGTFFDWLLRGRLQVGAVGLALYHGRGDQCVVVSGVGDQQIVQFQQTDRVDVFPHSFWGPISPNLRELEGHRYEGTVGHEPGDVLSPHHVKLSGDHSRSLQGTPRVERTDVGGVYCGDHYGTRLTVVKQDCSLLLVPINGKDLPLFFFVFFFFLILSLSSFSSSDFSDFLRRLLLFRVSSYYILLGHMHGWTHAGYILVSGGEPSWTRQFVGHFPLHSECFIPILPVLSGWIPKSHHSPKRMNNPNTTPKLSIHVFFSPHIH